MGWASMFYCLNFGLFQKTKAYKLATNKKNNKKMKIFSTLTEVVNFGV